MKQFGASFTFDGLTTSDFYVWVSGIHTFDTPSREAEFVTIPGRSGDLVLDGNRYSNKEIVYPCFIARAFPDRFDEFRAAMMSRAGRYLQLEDTYHPDEVRLGTFLGDIDPTTGIYNQSGQFEVRFNCQPQRWLKSGLLPTTLTGDGTLTNPTLFTARPSIRIYGTGELVVNGVTVQVAANNYPYIDLDSQALDAFYGASSANSLVTISGNDFPTLTPGENTIALDGPTQVIIMPRWFSV